MKSWGLNSSKCKLNYSSNEGELIEIDGTWYDSSACIKKDDWSSNPLEWSLETLGGSSIQSGCDVTDEKGSTNEMLSRCKVEEEEGVLRLLLEEAPLISISGSGRGLTISESECDLVFLKGARFD